MSFSAFEPDARQSDALGRYRRASRLGFAAGVLVVIALGVLACSSTGVEPGDANPTAPSSPPAAAPPPAIPTPARTPVPETAAPAQASADSPVAQYLADPAAIQRASQLFRAVCTGYCHSTQPTADRVAPNLFDCEWTHGSSDQEIFNSIAVGIPDTQMQGFGERLPHEDLWKMVAYMRQKSTCKG